MRKILLSLVVMIGPPCVGLLFVSHVFVLAQDAPKPKTDAYGDPLPTGAVARMGTVRLRHHTIIRSLALSPNGKIAASAGGWINYDPNECIRLWDVATGKEIHRLADGESHIAFVAFSPDGSVLASIHDDDSGIRLWDLANGKLKQRLRLKADAPGDFVYGERMAFAPDGKTVACWGRDKTVRILELGTGNQVANWAAPMTSCLFFSHDGKVLVTNDKDALSFWNPSTGKSWQGVKPLQDAMTPRFLGPDGKLLICTGGKSGREVVCWNWKSGAVVRKIPGEPLGWSANGRFIAIRDKTEICVWDLAREEEAHRFPPANRFVGHSVINDFTGGMTNDGRILVSADWNTIRAIDARSGKDVHDGSGHWYDVVSVGFSADDSQAISAGDTSVRIWEIAGAKQTAHLTGDRAGLITNAALTKDGQMLATGASDGIARVWDLAKHTQKITLDVGSSEPLVAFSPNGRALATRGRLDAEKRGLQLWDLQTGVAGRRFGSGNMQEALAFLPDGNLVDLSIHISVFNPRTGERVRDFGKMPFHNPSTGLAISSDGRIAALGNVGPSSRYALAQDVTLWEMASATMIARMEGHKGIVTALAYSPGGKLLATGGWDGTVRVWDWFSGEELACYSGHRGGVLSIAFSHDGRLLMSGGSDTSVLVWEVSSLAPRKVPMPLDAEKLAGLWDRLLDRDAATAYAALTPFVGSSGNAVSFLKQHLMTKEKVEGRVATLLATLDGPVFKARETANRELEGMLPEIEPILKKAIKGSLSAEARTRVDALLAKPALPKGEISGYQLRQLRAVQVLEYINSENSRLLLRELTSAGAQDFTTQEANRALQRIETQMKKKS